VLVLGCSDAAYSLGFITVAIGDISINCTASTSHKVAIRCFLDTRLVTSAANRTQKQLNQQSTLVGLIFVPSARVQTLRELHSEAAGRNEALVALEALTQESGVRQERLREAMQACQHLQSELEAAQVAPVLIALQLCESRVACVCSGKLLPHGASECGAKGGWPSAGDEVLDKLCWQRFTDIMSKVQL
jgi:hypothetical protein